jgi:hypothetical protein
MQVYKRHACVSNVSKISLYAAVFTADKRRGRRSVLSRFAGVSPGRAGARLLVVAAAGR